MTRAIFLLEPKRPFKLCYRELKEIGMKMYYLALGAILKTAIVSLIILSPAEGHAASTCTNLPNPEALRTALKAARAQDNGGLNLEMWGAIVDRSGIICEVVYTGPAVDAQWPGSRLISVQKAYTANAFSLPALALSTANLYSATQPGGSLFGLQESNPINGYLAYSGAVSRHGENNDPLVGQLIGGINVFGGGLPLYSSNGTIIGGLGVSGDTSCADHNIAWRTRSALNLDYVPNGVAADKTDQIIYDISGNKSAGGYGHPTCGGTEANVVKILPATKKILGQ
jgi:uncharacterized protein GlcG (DUF336 family)